MLLLKPHWNWVKMQRVFWPPSKPIEHAALLEIGEPAVLTQKGAAAIQGCQVSWHMWKDEEEPPWVFWLRLWIHLTQESLLRVAKIRH